MASHKKHPIFIRIKSNDNSVVCVNPQHLSSFQILEKAKVRVKDDTQPDGFKLVETDTIRFYFPQGTTLGYSVGVDITQNEFNYVCATLLEYLYLNEIEFRAKTDAIEKAKAEEWNAIKAAEQAEEAALTKAHKTEA